MSHEMYHASQPVSAWVIGGAALPLADGTGDGPAEHRREHVADRVRERVLRRVREQRRDRVLGDVLDHLPGDRHRQRRPEAKAEREHRRDADEAVDERPRIDEGVVDLAPARPLAARPCC